MSTPENGPDVIAGDKGKQKFRILIYTAFFPALLTLMNGLCGLGCIHFATKHGLGARLDNVLCSSFWWASVLIFIAVACDMFDGRVARMTRNTSDFGAQLDSLCDAISFGVAPAILILRVSVAAFRATDIAWFLPDITIERIFWCFSGIYVSCAVLRLARFNVESDEAEECHVIFKGLPTPGAASSVTMVALLYLNLSGETPNWLSPELLNAFAAILLPILLLIAGLLMISRVEYIHFANYYIKGNKPIGTLIKFVFILGLIILEPYVTLSVVTVVYLLSGPVVKVLSITTGRKVFNEYKQQ